jgi:hypothetical protein
MPEWIQRTEAEVVGRMPKRSIGSPAEQAGLEGLANA